MLFAAPAALGEEVALALLGLELGLCWVYGRLIPLSSAPNSPFPSKIWEECKARWAQPDRRLCTQAAAHRWQNANFYCGKTIFSFWILGFVCFWKAFGSHSKYVYKKSRTGKVQVRVWIQPQQTEAEAVPDVWSCQTTVHLKQKAEEGERNLSNVFHVEFQAI